VAVRSPDSNVFFVVELDVQPGQLDDLREVAQEMVELAQHNEPATLNYEYFLSDDGARCHIYERYVDSNALLSHSLSFPEELQQRAQAFRPLRLTAYGNVPHTVRTSRIDPIRTVVPGFEAAYFSRLSGLTR
jgi:quinol monooxygenase YgiN